MRIGVPREIKDHENRVALTPSGAGILARAGHQVLVEQGAGEGSGFPDDDYRLQGAEVVVRDRAWGAELVVKIKEPLPAEYHYLRGQILFTYLHLAGVDPGLTRALLESGTTALAYETLRDGQGRLPLLAPMSAIAGNMSVTVASHWLQKPHGGRGVQLGRVLGDPSGKVVVVGDGTVGSHAARTAAAMGGRVVLFGRNPGRGTVLQREIGGELKWLQSTPEAIAGELQEADVLVGAVLIPGGRAPHVVSEAMVRGMPAGSVVVDVSIDQGGAVETSRPTSHSDPVFTLHGVIHYGVTNMPGAYPRTATCALTSATLPYIEKLAQEGLEAWFRDPGLRAAINTWRGRITCRAVAESLGMEQEYLDLETVSP